MALEKCNEVIRRFGDVLAMPCQDPDHLLMTDDPLCCCVEHSSSSSPSSSTSSSSPSSSLSSSSSSSSSLSSSSVSSSSVASSSSTQSSSASSSVPSSSPSSSEVPSSSSSGSGSVGSSSSLGSSSYVPSSSTPSSSPSSPVGPNMYWCYTITEYVGWGCTGMLLHVYYNQCLARESEGCEDFWYSFGGINTKRSRQYVLSGGGPYLIEDDCACGDSSSSQSAVEYCTDCDPLLDDCYELGDISGFQGDWVILNDNDGWQIGNQDGSDENCQWVNYTYDTDGNVYWAFLTYYTGSGWILTILVEVSGYRYWVRLKKELGSGESYPVIEPCNPKGLYVLDSSYPYEGSGGSILVTDC